MPEGGDLLAVDQPRQDAAVVGGLGLDELERVEQFRGGGLAVAADGAAEHVAEVSAGVVGRGHDEAVGGEVGGEEGGLQPEPAEAVAEQHDGEGAVVGGGGTSRSASMVRPAGMSAVRSASMASGTNPRAS